MLQSLWVFTLSYALFLTLVAKHILLADDLKQKLVHLIGLFNQFLQQQNVGNPQSVLWQNSNLQPVNL